VIHEPAHLLLVALLYPAEQADFVYLCRQTGLTKGNLGAHLTRWHPPPARRQGLEIVGSTLLVAALLVAVQWGLVGAVDAATLAWAMALTLLAWAALLLVPHRTARGAARRRGPLTPLWERGGSSEVPSRSAAWGARAQPNTSGAWRMTCSACARRNRSFSGWPSSWRNMAWSNGS
jgi:hypothetical protein